MHLESNVLDMANLPIQGTVLEQPLHVRVALQRTQNLNFHLLDKPWVGQQTRYQNLPKYMHLPKRMQPTIERT